LFDDLVETVLIDHRSDEGLERISEVARGDTHRSIGARILCGNGFHTERHRPSSKIERRYSLSQ
jgi:hypothetical protein